MAQIKSQNSAEQQLPRLQSYGVETRPEGGKWTASKCVCVATLERGADGLRVAGLPGIRFGAEIGTLLDGGYQKFWQTPTRKIPATAEHLKAMHQFQEALAAGLACGNLYNVSLGTVSTNYHYDRVKGRANP
jgi:hypothetical protein